ncbi:MAG: hypothetical protein ACOCNT_06460, partial [Bacteroidales bacterium]
NVVERTANALDGYLFHAVLFLKSAISRHGKVQVNLTLLIWLTKSFKTKSPASSLEAGLNCCMVKCYVWHALSRFALLSKVKVKAEKLCVVCHK